MAKANIKTERLKMVPFTTEYLSDEYVGWLNNKHLMRYSEQRHKNHDINSCIIYLDSFNGTDSYFWAICDLERENLHIGNISASIDEYNRIADISVLIGHKAATRKGYGQEAWNGISRFLLKEKKIRKVTAGTLSLNEPMLKIMKRSGMIADGIRKKHYVCIGQEVDVIYMALYNY